MTSNVNLTAPGASGWPGNSCGNSAPHNVTATPAKTAGTATPVSSASRTREFETLLLSANPARQADVCADRERCLFGPYPTLSQLRRRYGRNAPEAWLIPQLNDLGEFCGCRDKTTPAQTRELAGLIAEEYADMKVSELMWFFRQFKKAAYGRLYGTLDPLTLMDALRRFDRQRRDEAALRERAMGERRERERRAQAVTREQYEQTDVYRRVQAELRRRREAKAREAEESARKSGGGAA